MKKHSIKLPILVLLLCAVSFAHSNDAKAKDEAAIRANVAQIVKGWNEKSGAEFTKPFAEESDYVVINGVHIKGRAANAAGHQQIFDTIYKDSDLAATVEQIRFLRPDIAIVHALVERFPKADRSQTTKGRLTMVMVKNGAKWEIEAFQNTQIQTR